MAGAEVEMVGVAEDDLGAQVFEGLLGDGFYGGGGAYGHEDWGLDLAVGEMEGDAAGWALGLVGLEG
jgi:hypothetical protein